MKLPAGGGKSFMGWYQECLSKSELDISKVMEVLNAASYSRKLHNIPQKFVARFDGTWQLGGYGGGLSEFEKYVSRLKNKRLYDCMEDCSKIIFQSMFSKNLAETLWGSEIEKSSIVVCNPIRSREVWSNIWKQSVPQDIIKVLSYHRHTPLKCSYLAPEVAVRLAEEFDCCVELVIIGDSHPIAERYLRQGIAKHSGGKTRIRRILGDIATVARECIDSHFVLNLAHFDPCPNVVCESAGINIPQLLVRSGGIPEIVGDSYPFFLEPFANNRSWLKKNTLDGMNWSVLFAAVDKILTGRFNDIYEYANEFHSPEKVFRRYVDFSTL